MIQRSAGDEGNQEGALCASIRHKLMKPHPSAGSDRTKLDFTVLLLGLLAMIRGDKFISIS